jgi:triacylglycerol lipase
MLRKRVLAGALAFALGAAAPAAAQDFPPAPGIAPPGSNDFNCRSATHPTPVILVHGTFGDMTQAWPVFAPALEQAGYCVFALDLVRRGMAPMDQSADKLAAFVDEVRSKTGAAEVSLVGHSQGGMLARYVARFRGKLDVIDDIVGLAPSSHGTTTPLAGPAGDLFDCPACKEQIAGSEFIQKLNAGDEAPAPIFYTVVSTTHDEVVTPYQSQELAGPQATNIVLQDRCPADPTDHVAITYDPVALQWTLDALGRPGAANPAFEPDCTGATFGNDPGIPGAVPGGPRGPTGAARGASRFVLERRLHHKAGRVALRGSCIGPAGSVCNGRLELLRGKRRIALRTFSVGAGRRMTFHARFGHGVLRARAVTLQPGGGTATSSRRYRVR